MENLQERLVLSSSSSSSCTSSSNPHLMSFTAECWSITKLTTQEILCAIQPTIVSEQRRKEIIDYVRRLIRDSFGNEVLPFGSMPLKTYLPDGDIDLTALCPEDDEEDFARDVCTILESERQTGSEFRVDDISYIQAKVKIVKCMVQDISVDISFNQTGGLSTLCFLEQINILIGKDHLFKRSVILIKAWCYYEGRILGSHCGLLSTYALEILVLHVINLFYSTLYCPLAVLYRFLDYYRTFDWESCGVSVLGPVSISSLLTGAPEAAESANKPLLISKEFLRSCKEAFSVPTRASECTRQPFLVKYINIQDPLRDYNNLGRSISLGNSYRFRYAISVGAQKLKEILMQPKGKINDELKEFFNNTLDRNGGKQGAQEGGVVPSGPGSSKFCSLQGDYYSCLNNLHYGQFYHANLSSFSIHPGSFDDSFKWKYSSQSYAPWEYGNHFASMLLSQNTYQLSSPSFQFEEQESNMNACFPNLSFWPESSQLSGLAYHFEQKVSQGTGTFIPNTAQIFRNNVNRWEHDPEQELRNGISQTKWEIKKRVSPTSSVMLEPEQEARNDSERTLWGPSPKPEYDGEMIPKLKNLTPSLKPEQEDRKDSKPTSHVLSPKHKDEEGMISKLKDLTPSWKPEQEGGKDSEPTSHVLSPKHEDEEKLKNLAPSLKPEQEGRKDSEPTSEVLLAKHEDEEVMISQLMNLAPSLKPEQEVGQDSEPTSQVLLPKHEDEEGVISELKNLAPSLKPEQEGRKDSEPTSQVLLPKHEDEEGVISELKNLAPSLKPVQEGQSDQESEAQGLMLEPEFENSHSQEAKEADPVLETECETVKNGVSDQELLLLKPEGEQRKSQTPESSPHGPPVNSPPANYDHIEVAPEMNQRGEAVTSGCLLSLEEFPELPHKVKQESSLDPKDSDKELVPEQPYSLADNNDFPPLGSKPKGKYKSWRRK